MALISFRWVPLVVAIFLVLVAVLMPGDWISGLRHRWWFVTYPLDRIESVRSAVNLIHAILFLLLGMAAGMALRRWRLGQMALALLVLGVSTELLQIFVPGRHPRLADVAVDVLAGLLGLALIRAVSK